MKNKFNSLEDLYIAVQQKDKGNDKKSYTKQLLKSGKFKIAQKMGIIRI